MYISVTQHTVLETQIIRWYKTLTQNLSLANEWYKVNRLGYIVIV